MALTSTPLLKWNLQPSEALSIVVLTGDASYPTGGYPVTPALFFLTAFASTSDFQLQAPPTFAPYLLGADGQGGTYATINQANGNLQLFVSSTGAEVANATNVSTIKTICLAFGHGGG
jgi:hypothetical protein